MVERYLKYEKDLRELKDFSEDLNRAIETTENNISKEEDFLENYINCNEDVFAEYVETAQDNIKFYFNRQISKLQIQLDNLRMKE